MGTDGTQIDWVEPEYCSVRNILKHPKYAGIYAYPLEKTVLEPQPDGIIKHKQCPVSPEEWEVVLYDNHPAYISIEKYEANLKKIPMKAQRYAPSSGGAPHKGAALLTGLIVCRQCHHKMQVHYRKTGISYLCRKGQRQREGGPQGCFSFRADELERQLVAQLLHAVSPAGITAAELAIQRIENERQERRRILEDELENHQYQADLARRRFDKIDPANRLVFDTLGAELEAALQASRPNEESRSA